MIDISISLPEEFATFQGIVPDPTVLSGCGGIVLESELNCNDVLSGRGGVINNIMGNVQFRDIIDQHKTKYCDATAKRIEKKFYAARVVAIVRCMSPPGRFLRKDEKTGHWKEIGDDKAREKAMQSLRDEKKKESPLNLPSTKKKQQSSKTAMISFLKEELSHGTNQKTTDSSQTAEANFEVLPPDLLRYPSMSTIDMENICSCTDSIPDPIELFRDTTSLLIMSTTDVIAPLNFQLNDQDVTSLGNTVFFSDVLSCNTGFTLPVGNECRGDLMSDDLDFEIDIPGIGEDTFANFPRESMHPRSNSRQRQVNLMPYWRTTSVSSTDDFISVLSRLYSDVSITSQMSFEPINLIRGQTFDSGMPRNYSNMVFAGVL